MAWTFYVAPLAEAAVVPYWCVWRIHASAVVDMFQCAPLPNIYSLSFVWQTAPTRRRVLRQLMKSSQLAWYQRVL